MHLFISLPILFFFFFFFFFLLLLFALSLHRKSHLHHDTHSTFAHLQGAFIGTTDCLVFHVPVILPYILNIKYDLMFDLKLKVGHRDFDIYLEDYFNCLG